VFDLIGYVDGHDSRGEGVVYEGLLLFCYILLGLVLVTAVLVKGQWPADEVEPSEMQSIEVAFPQ
jgi:hypothetical protein